MIYKGYDIAQSNSRGGKAGQGRNQTATIQVREPIGDAQSTRRVSEYPEGCGGDYLMKAQFRFPAHDSEKRAAAIAKAKAWVDKAARL